MDGWQRFSGGCQGWVQLRPARTCSLCMKPRPARHPFWPRPKAFKHTSRQRHLNNSQSASQCLPPHPHKSTPPLFTCAPCSLLILIMVLEKAMDAGPSTASTCSLTMSIASRLCTPSAEGGEGGRGGG